MTSIRHSPRLSHRDVPRAPAGGTRVVRREAQAVDGFEGPRSPHAKARPLQRGMTGSQVRTLQQRLLAKGFMGHRDVASGPGVFGPRTEAAVKRAQSALGLPVTGVASAPTMAALAGDVFRSANDDSPTVPVKMAAVRAQLAQTISDSDEPTTPMGEGLLEARAAS